MKSMTISEYRVGTFKLINRLEELVMKLMLEIEPSTLLYEGPRDPEWRGTELVDVFEWSVQWKLISDDPDNTAFLSALSELDQKISSLNAPRVYPRGLYRDILEFGDKSNEVRNTWAEKQRMFIAYERSDRVPDDDLQRCVESEFKNMKQAFLKDIKAIKRSILLFENERNEAEESFID